MGPRLREYCRQCQAEMVRPAGTIFTNPGARYLAEHCNQSIANALSNCHGYNRLLLGLVNQCGWLALGHALVKNYQPSKHNNARLKGYARSRIKFHETRVELCKFEMATSTIIYILDLNGPLLSDMFGLQLSVGPPSDE